MLLQLDGSHHRWLGDNGGQFTLLLAVDDATGIVANAAFCEYENTRDYLLLMRGLVRRYGIPIAIYTDRHSVFRHVPGSGLAGAPTQFSRAMDELGVQMIFAMSPQAKGRVERTAGTFQDRLVAELRLAGATTVDEANTVLKDFLVRFNRRFGVPAYESNAAYRTVDSGMSLDTVLCFKYRRRVARDNTVRFRWCTLQLLPGRELPSYAGATVEVIEGLDGELSVQHNGCLIPTQKAPPHPGILRHLNGSSPHHDVPYLNGNGLDRRWVEVLASLDGERTSEAVHGGADANGPSSTPRSTKISPRKPTALQVARWKAVQKLKRRGLSIRGVAKVLGVHRSTAKNTWRLHVRRSCDPEFRLPPPDSDNMGTLAK